MPGPKDTPKDSLSIAREVDALCDRYEQARARGGEVRLEDFLPIAEPLRAAALVELVRLEFEHRLQAGEGVHAEEYYGRYPELRQDAALARRLQDAVRRLRPEARPTLQPWETELGAPSAAAVSPPGQPPEKFGRYRIVKLLGQGGMGVVYQAHDTNLDRSVALKVMRLGVEDPDRVERFYREARIAASFTHPNLCPIYDAGELDGVHYLTMPLLVGEPLAARLRRTGPMPVQTAATIAASIARAVYEAHRAGVLHRDLKPANIMIDDRQHPVVLDFGLAKRFGPLDPRITAPGVILGTPAYMAPERPRT
jgi:eukaryotic-like serine/threonine-protein kinase